MSDTFLIRGLGGRRALSGAVKISGAKNNALKVIAGTLLFRGDVLLRNVPNIADVKAMLELLSNMGASVTKLDPHSYRINTDKLSRTNLSEEIAKRMRASVVLTGPTLARFGKVSFPHPGGCVIGPRPIDLFLSGFGKLGAKVEQKKNRFHLSGKLKGAKIFFKNQSVTATETFMMTAVLAEGKTVIGNAAMEPEIKHLADFLVASGAKIKGAGTPTIEITGTGKLKAKRAYSVMPDRIEAGSFLILAALVGKNVVIEDCEPDHMGAIIELLRESGAQISVGRSSLRVKTASVPLKAVNIKTHEYPGFPTDLQAPAVVYLTQVQGDGLVFETIFEGRLNYVEELVRMGADIKLFNPHQLEVKGPTPLHSREMESPDLRAGLAFVIAAVVAQGESVISNIKYIDRGYENIEGKLTGLGVDIKRI